MTQIEGSQTAAGLADLKKDALVRKAEEIASGKGWVPAIFKGKAQD